jgi:transcriptional regulator with PAS, ATPase and Fis domain
VELFGSLPGAFTDATEKAGIFEQVTEYDNGNAINGGTVFLDEVGLMELPDQAFLLRVLQENNVYRMGHDERKAGKDKVKIKIARELIESRLFGKIPVKFRLVAATNEDLLENTKRGDFRLDLFYRIARAIIKLPPLRNRSKRDFNLLFQYFLHRFNKEHGRNVTLSNSGGFVVPPSSDLIEHLWATFPWRGNVRELEGLVDTIVALSASDRSEPLGLRDIPEFHWQKQEVFERKE